MTIVIIISIEFLFGDLRISPVNCAARSKSKEQRASENNGWSTSQEIFLLKVNIHCYIHNVSHAYFARLVKQTQYTSELSYNHRHYLSVYEIVVLTFYKNLPSS
jgi:succinylglutamate desuccinylase